MHLAPSEDQAALVAQVRRFLEKEVPPARVRAAEPLGFDAKLWQALSELGVATMTLSTSRDGSGSSLLECALVAEALGAHLAPIPFAEVVAAHAALAFADAPATVVAQANAIVGSADRSTAALTPRLTPPLTLALRPARDGVFSLVPAGAVAASVVGLDGDELVLVEAAPGELVDGGAPSSPRNLGDSPLANRSAVGSRRTVLARGPAAREAFARALDVWRVLSAAALAGLATRSLEIGVAYASAREQFGVPIGSFQALAHRLADVAAVVEGAPLLVREAAWAADEGERCASVLASAAYLFAGEAAQQSAGESLHVHGGYGFTWECEVQMWFKRIMFDRSALGTPERHRERQARLGGW